MTRSLPGHLERGQFAQVLVNQREQLIRGRAIAPCQVFENVGNVAHGEDGSMDSPRLQRGGLCCDDIGRLTLPPKASPSPRQRSAGRGLGRGAQTRWQKRPRAVSRGDALPSPLRQRRKGRSSHRLVAVSRSARLTGCARKNIAYRWRLPHSGLALAGEMAEWLKAHAWKA